SLNPATLTCMAASTSGTISTFNASETITLHLDSAGGPVLATAPGTVTTNASGSAAFSVTIPQTTGGSHTVYAVGSAGSQATATLTVSPCLILSVTTYNTLPASPQATLTGFTSPDTISF